MRRFYLAFPYRRTVRADRSWSHYRPLVSCEAQEERCWYLETVDANGWGERELEVVLERNRRMFEQVAEVRRREGDTKGADN